MGAVARIRQQQQPAPQTVQQRARQVTVFAIEGGVVQTIDLQTNGGFLVFSPDMALKCEAAGAEYLYINPANAIAINVQDPPAPPQLVAVPDLEGETETEDPPEAATEAEEAS